MIAIAIAVILPWAGLLPIGGVLGVALALGLVIAACHGWGLLVRRLAGSPDAPAPLVVLWGLALLVVLAGVALAAHAFAHTAQLALVIAGAALHTALVVLDRRAIPAPRAVTERLAIVPVIVVALIATLHVLGAAGDTLASPFDDDGSLPGQLRRLLDTGTLGDPIGFARVSQLGGHVAISALITAVTDPSLYRAADGLGFALLLALGLAQLRPRSAAGGTWAVLGTLALASYPVVATDASPRWLPIALVVALGATFERYHAAEDDRLLWPLGLLAAAATALRSELAPVAIALLVAAGLVGIGRSGGGRRALALIVVPLVAVAPYLVVRMLAAGSVPATALARGHGFALPLLGTLGLVAVATWIIVRSLDGAPRWIAIATVAGATGGAPILAGGGLALGLSLLRTAAPQPRAAALVIALLATSLIYDARDTPGRGRWVRRYAELAANLEYLRHAYPAPAQPDPSGPLLAQVPAGATVVVWVTRPEALDYAHHRILDLRTPRTAPRRAAVLRALAADYLLVEDDHLPSDRARRDLLYRFACPPGATARYCADDLEAIALDHPTVASDGNLRLVRLRGSAN